MEGKEKVDNLVDILDNLSLEKDQPDQVHPSQHKLQFSNDFLTPISVKSSKWSHNKVNIHNIKMQKGPFDKYTSKHIIIPPSNPLPIPTHTVNIEDSITDESDQIRADELISELLKPKEYPKTPIDPKDRIIDNLKVELFDHQVLGLKFMLHREKVKPESRSYLKDIYGICEDNEDETIFNNGGILADDMGLGKTIQIIALILSNQIKKSKNQLNLNKLKSTLIVCPASLVSQWNSELNLMAPSLSVLLYHGPKRITESKLLHSHDVIITSYQTLSAENQKEFSPLYDKDYPFRRIVLDEAHLIKNKETKSHKACCELIGKKRWCLTGTPIQNKIDELYSLFKFLGVNKYENLDIWNVKINSLINAKNKEDVSKGLKRLHLILDKFMIRRTKQILIDKNVLTVTKTIHTEILDFIPFERKIYNKVKDRIISQILEKNIELDDKNNGELHSNDNIKLDYMSALAYLLRLRQLCCHWELLFNIKQQYDDDSLLNEIKNSIPEKSPSSEKDFNNALNHEDYEDILKLMKDMNIDENNKINNKDNFDDDDLKFNSTNSIKLQRILNILKNDDKKNPRKTIIFSEFTSMLDILSKTLLDNNIKFVRYDGKMDKKSKDETLAKLKDDKHVHVLLCSLKCGAYGLNITSCSRIILYEPFWNPAIGSQAIDRSYRIGQIHNVDVHEFFISDTIEIRIQELQNKKRQLMEAVVDKDAKSTLKMISNGLSKQELFTLLGF